MKVGLDVRISLVKVLSTGGRKSSPQTSHLSPHSPPQRLEGNDRPCLLIFLVNCVAAFLHRDLYSEVALLFPQFFLAQSLCGGEYPPPPKKLFPEKMKSYFKY